MKQVGYGVLMNGKPRGIWPLPASRQYQTAFRLRREYPRAVIEVVEVFAGKAVNDPVGARHGTGEAS